MRVNRLLGALLALVLTAPAALHAQEGRGWMGIAFEWETEGAAQARVAQVVPGSGGERAGVRRGDVVLSIDGQPASEAAVDRLRERLKAGDTVRLRLRRDGREMEQAVIAGERRERVAVIDRDGDETITVRIPRERMRVMMDSVRVHMEHLGGVMDSLHSRLRILHGDGDSTVVVHVNPRPGARGQVRIFRRDSAGGHRIEVDSVIMLHDSLMSHGLRMRMEGEARRMEGDVRRLEGDARRLETERMRIEDFPFGDLDPSVPFYMEMGRRGVAGAELAEMNAGLARYFRTERGVLVLQVSEGTPMARAGVQAGDVIVRAGGAEVSDVGDLRRAFSDARGDGKLRLELMRQGRNQSVEMQWEPVRTRVWAPAQEGEVRARARARTRSN